MLARLQQATTLSLLLVALGWAAWFGRDGRWGWAMAGAALVLFGYALVLGLEFVLLAKAHGDDPAPRATTAQLVRAWWGEVRSAPRVFCWQQPFRSRVEPDFLPVDSHGRLGVVLVHGFVCNRGFWNAWMRRFRSADVPFVAVDLEPVFGRIDDYVPIVDAAVVRGIPYRRLTQGSLVQFGWGSKQRRIWAAEVDNTSAVAESIAQDKDLTKRLLAAAGVPVPTGRPVTDFADACAVAGEIGWPVVVKPRDGNQGKGVTVNITTREALEKAYATATEFRDDILVERYMPGNDFRLLVVGNKLVAAARRDPPKVVGDGEQDRKSVV